MRIKQKMFRFIRALFQKETLDARMNDEMRSHIEMQTQENIEAGMKPEEARYAALRQFGWVESIKDACRAQRGVSWIESLGQDLRYGLRMLRKSPGFTAVAVLTLALGIGANTAMLSFVNAILLRALPYQEPDRLVMVFENHPTNGWFKLGIDATLLDEWRKQTTVFEQLGAVRSYGNFTLTGRGQPETFKGSSFSANIFPLLGINPILGRTFLPSEEILGNHVTQRTREIGIRAALGARRVDLLNLVLGQGMRLVGFGVLIGLAGAFALTRLIRTFLFDIAPTDPLTFAAVPLALVIVSALACWLPARRAANVDPIVALRNEG